MRINSVLSAALIGGAEIVQGFYLPGVNPHSFKDGDS